MTPAVRTTVCILLGVLVMPTHADDSKSVAPFGVKPAPEIVIMNGKVWTGVPGAEEAQALAITGPNITAVGADTAIRALADERTQVIDAGGRRVIPGITDTHTHFIETGLQLNRLELRDARNKEEFIERINAAAARLTPGRWLLGGNFTVESWPDPQSPDKAWIDPFTPHTPVFLTRTDGHQALANRVALKFARITRKGPPDPPGGEIERDPQTGEPTGILKDAAMNLVLQHIPEVSTRERYDALLLACKMANAWGITGVHDMSMPGDLAAFALAHQNGTLSVRIHAFLQVEDFKAHEPALVAAAARADDVFRVAGYKAYMDGSLGSRTAYMRAPFSDSTPDMRYPRGMRSGHAHDLDVFAHDLRWAHDRGYQLAVHAIGDEAIHELLGIFAGLPDVRKRRHRVEHTQHLLGEDVPRFAELGVVASMQPLHKADDGRWAESVLGPRRSYYAYAFKSLLEANATVCFGSDCPVAPANPFAGITAAVTARTADDKTWVPEQRISRTQALRCYTVTPPYAAFQDQILGSLEPGKRADLVILDTDVLAAAIETIGAAESWLTLMNGRVVWRKPGGR